MSLDPLKIGVVFGSTRPNRHSDAVGAWVLERANEHPELAAEAIDLAEVALPFFDEPLPPIMGQYAHEHTRAWSATISAYDGFVFVTPEYNRSMPAVLKNAIDFLYTEWKDKAAGFVSYGADAGGARAVEHLRTILGELHVADVRTMVPLSLAADFEGYTRFTPTATATTKVHHMLDELATWAAALRDVRRRRPETT